MTAVDDGPVIKNENVMENFKSNFETTITDSTLYSSSISTESFLVSTLVDATTQIIDAMSTAATDFDDGSSWSSTDMPSSIRPALIDVSNGTLTPAIDHLLFSTIDYILFAMLLGLSTMIGIYYGFISDKKQDNTAEYLLGGKTMNIFPISASLIATHISGITLLGVPSEMYAQGTQYWAFIVPAMSVAITMSFIYLPLFYELQLTSCFTYLEQRFDRSVRLTASFVYAISCLIYIPIVLYVPALAFSQVTGINVHLITPIICVVCIFYTTVGGLRAVVWTDTLQFILMLGAIITVIVLGIKSIGGFWEVWEAADRGKRLIFFNLDPNPLLRTSFWTVAFGLSTMWISNLGVSQGCLQRFLSVPSLSKARRSVIIFTLGLIVIKSCSCFTGLLIYAEYEKCDPVTMKQVQKLDQILPFYVMHVAGKIPGLPGLFIAGIFSAALSTMSSSLNTLSGTIYEDFLRKHLPNATEKKASNIMKIIVVILGTIEFTLVFIVEKLGSVLHVAISLSGVTAGTLLGIFTMGMVLRNANTKGVICGAIASLIGVGSILIGAQSAVKPPGLAMRTDGCEENIFNTTNSFLESSTMPTPYSHVQDDVHWIFKISFMYYTLVGVIIVFAIGYPVSLCTGGCEKIDERLLTPLLRSKKWKEAQKNSQHEMHIHYTDIPNALIELKKCTE